MAKKETKKKEAVKETTKKETAKKTTKKKADTVTFYTDRKYLYDNGMNIQFRDGKYETSNKEEIEYLTKKGYIQGK